MYSVFFQIEALLSLKNVCLPQIEINFNIVLTHAKISLYWQETPIGNPSILRCAEHNF